MASDTGPFDWWNWWKNTNPAESWKNWATGWKNWVPDPAKTYVSSPIELPVKVNQILRGRGPPPAVENNLYSVILPFREPFTTIHEDCIKPPMEQAGFKVMKADDNAADQTTFGCIQSRTL